MDGSTPGGVRPVPKFLSDPQSAVDSSQRDKHSLSCHQNKSYYDVRADVDDGVVITIDNKFYWTRQQIYYYIASVNTFLIKNVLADITRIFNSNNIT